MRESVQRRRGPWRFNVTNHQDNTVQTISDGAGTSHLLVIGQISRFGITLLTAVLLGLSLLPVGVLATLTSVMHVSLLVVWAVLYLCGAALTVLAMVALAVTYHRFEPGEGY